MTAENTDQQFRIEHDTMGEVKVPVNALYRAQTQRAVENFPISGKGLEPAHIHALAQVKKAAAKANAELGIISQERADAIVAAADQVIAGDHDDQYPIDVFQTGSGTSSNMNTNEVLATLATRALKEAGSEDEVHPNDHVNASQSSNDVFPTSVHVAVTAALVNDLVPALDHLAVSLERLDALLDTPVQRIGLSATVEPAAEVARFLGGTQPVTVVRPASAKRWDLTVTVPVPDLTGVVIRQAHGVARDARFTVEVAERRTDPAVPAGAVIEQHPAPGEQATPGTAVRVVLSEGRAVRPVPDVTGQDPETARTTLADDGWDARVHRLPLPLSGRGESRVLHQSPAAGTALPEGTAVHVWVG